MWADVEGEKEICEDKNIEGEAEGEGEGAEIDRRCWKYYMPTLELSALRRKLHVFARDHVMTKDANKILSYVSGELPEACRE